MCYYVLCAVDKTLNLTHNDHEETVTNAESKGVYFSKLGPAAPCISGDLSELSGSFKGLLWFKMWVVVL